MKRIFVLPLLFLNSFCYSKTTIETLWDSIIHNNTDVNSVRTSYQNAVIDYKTLQGLFIPGISLNSTTNFGENYSKGDYPSYINNSLLIEQKLPGGARLDLSASYNLGYAEYNEQTYVNQTPKIGLTYSQSMLPFYLQGTLFSPDIKLLKINKEYQKKYLDYICKEKIKTLTKEYIYSLIYKNKSEIYANSIAFKNQKKEIIRKLIEQGSQNQTNLLEIENSILLDIQNKTEIDSSYVQCVNNLSILTGLDFSEFNDEELPLIKNIDKENLIGSYGDPYKELCLLIINKYETQKILIRQDNAPSFSVSLSDIINLKDNKAGDWKDSWTDWKDDKKNTWVVGIGFDFTNCLRGNFGKQYKKNENELQTAKNSYNQYLIQCENLLGIYKNALDSFNYEVASTKKLITTNEQLLESKKELKNKGIISEYDYLNASEELKILKLTYETHKLYRWLYEFLIFIDYNEEDAV